MEIKAWSLTWLRGRQSTRCRSISGLTEAPSTNEREGKVRACADQELLKEVRCSRGRSERTYGLHSTIESCRASQKCREQMNDGLLAQVEREVLGRDGVFEKWEGSDSSPW
jgi:hypothetical protein